MDLTQNPYGIDKYTKLLLHMEGANSGTAFRDETGKTVSVVGTVITSTTKKRFGSTSQYIGGTSSSYLSLVDSADWYFGNGDFTVDFWYYALDYTNRILFCQTTNGETPKGFYTYMATTHLYSRWFNSGGTRLDTDITHGMSTGQWYHLAFVRSTTNLKVFINGISVYDSALFGVDTLYDTADVLCVGGGYTSSFSNNGYIDEFRLSAGIARWTANFIPPSRPYGGYAVKDGEMV